MSSILVSVLYPSAPNATFDMEYYQTKHMPLVSAKWANFGLKQYFVADLRAAPGPYSIQTTMVWEGTLENFQKAVAETGAEVMGDVANFSSEKPTLLTGTVLMSN
ncbi:hypothetical protein VMCG_06356 [Cytospora schulzeri]|uniref:EthD domain-containing protein n=1 Tax=Cytospora schulzeri TaxID=448051 RepID=A0A423W8C1_9PEZI|nr:hypothetical protein VMCG_06356 [Valsa malicola]